MGRPSRKRGFYERLVQRITSCKKRIEMLCSVNDAQDFETILERLIEDQVGKTLAHSKCAGAF
jgi:hypothetical protein